MTKGLLDEFGPERIRDTPLSESAFVGAGIGAALGGMRPIVEIMTVNFSLLALDQILNNAATLRYMSGGQFHVPLVIRMTTGAGRQLAAQHSHSLDGWYAHIPGIKVLTPATVDDAHGMLLAARRRSRPGADLRARQPLQHRRRVGSRRGSGRHRARRGPPPRARRVAHHVRRHRCGTRSPRPTSSPPRASTRRSSTSACSGPSTPNAIVASVRRTHRVVRRRRRLAQRQHRRGGERAHHGAGVLRARRSRWRACAARKYPCPTRSTSKTPLSPIRRRSSPPRGR